MLVSVRVFTLKIEWKTNKRSERHNSYYHIYWMMFCRKAIPKFLANQTPKSQQGPLLFNSLFVGSTWDFCYRIMVPAQWAPTGYKWGYNQVINPSYPFQKSIYIGDKSIHIGGRGPSCETCLLLNILQRILWSKWIRNQLHSVSANRNFWEW